MINKIGLCRTKYTKEILMIQELVYSKLPCNIRDAVCKPFMK